MRSMLKLTSLLFGVSLFSAAHVFAAPPGAQPGVGKIMQVNPGRVDNFQASQQAITRQNFNAGTAGRAELGTSGVGAALNGANRFDALKSFGTSKNFGNGGVGKSVYDPGRTLPSMGGKANQDTTGGVWVNQPNDKFNAGGGKLEQPLNDNAFGTNRGGITVGGGGLSNMVVPGGNDSGVVRAQLNNAEINGGTAVTLDLYGDNMIQLAVPDKTMAKLTDTQGQPLSNYAKRGGANAPATDVLINAHSAKSVLDNVVNITAVPQARSFEQRGGQIVLSGDAGSKLSPITKGQLGVKNAPAGGDIGSVVVKPSGSNLSGKLTVAGPVQGTSGKLGSINPLDGILDLKRGPDSLIGGWTGRPDPISCGTVCSSDGPTGNNAPPIPVFIVHSPTGGNGVTPNGILDDIPFSSSGSGTGSGNNAGNGPGPGSGTDGISSAQDGGGGDSGAGKTKFADVGRSSAAGGTAEDVFSGRDSGVQVKDGQPLVDRQYFDQTTADYLKTKAKRQRKQK